MVNSFREIVALWATPDAMAAELGVRVYAARKWRQRDSIPAEWWTAVAASPVAREKGVTVELMAELVAHPACPEPAPQTQAAE